MSVTPAVSVNHLTKVFKGSLGKGAFRAVHDVSFTVNPGEVYGLIGPNGSGKSTTMKAILGLQLPTAGETSIFGIPSTEVASRRSVGFLPENPYFYKHLNGRETLHFYGKLCGMRGDQLKSRAEEMLEMTGLEDAATRRVGGYSKGMLQRLGLAQALIHEPQLLGHMVREGRLDELIAVENQTEMVLENASPDLLARIAALVQAEGSGTRMLRSGHPRTTLERLFLEATNEPKKP